MAGSKKKTRKKAGKPRKSKARVRKAKKLPRKGAEAKKAGLKGIKSRLKALDLELLAIEKGLHADTKSVLMDGEMAAPKFRLVHMEPHTKNLRGYYKKMVLRCMKCNSRFDHEANLSPIEHEFNCPRCNEPHTLKFKPSSKFFTVESQGVDIVDTDD